MANTFATTLRTHHYSLTPTRIRLFAYLEKSGPITVNQLLHDNQGLADRASLYRTLALLRRLRVIEDIVIGGRRLIELSDNFDRHHHHHLTCRRCGRTITVSDPQLEKLITNLAKRSGFEAQSHHIEIDGLCSKCAS